MTEPTVPKDSAIVDVTETTEIVEVSQEITDLVKKEMPDATEEVKKETAALIEAIQKRAKLEMQAAGDLTREAYLKSVRQAQEAIEQNQAIAKERIDQAVGLIQQEAEKNWLVIDAIKTRAQAEIQSAGDVTRENYLKAVRQARETVEQNKFIERERIEGAVHEIHKQAEKNWLTIASEIESIGVRLADAAKTAWNALMASLSKSDRN
ncbi:hypothetical protein [Argonema antarcticum]|uniref:hypothetical protein n=1 Tax=Argonema antarcticum TaxID=2942763 RepID=UPI002013436D|nr:hypothetical protein [Argonema antarcticum]MCL1473380.1 hypothetical protein [Argonema antarcticum A004/B2]